MNWVAVFVRQSWLDYVAIVAMGSWHLPKPSSPTSKRRIFQWKWLWLPWVAGVYPASNLKFEFCSYQIYLVWSPHVVGNIPMTIPYKKKRIFLIAILIESYNFRTLDLFRIRIEGKIYSQTDWLAAISLNWEDYNLCSSV